MNDFSFSGVSADQATKLRSELELAIATPFNPAKQQLNSVDAIITTYNINAQPKTGALIREIFSENSSILAIYSSSFYKNEPLFGAVNLTLSYSELTRPQVYTKVLDALKGFKVERVICIPRYPDDVLTAIAIKELFNLPLCTYLVNDHDIYTEMIPTDLMRDLLNKSALRLAICPKIRDAYERRFELKFWLLPPMVPSQLITTEISFINAETHSAKSGIFIENTWNQRWLNILQNIIQASNVKIDHYQSSATSVQSKNLESQNHQAITNNSNPPNYLTDSQQISTKLRQYPYVVIPVSPFEQDDYQALDKLSFPGGVSFILATSNTPIIVLGSRKTATAYMVERLGIGVVADYDADSFRAAVDLICQPENQMSMRQNAVGKAPHFMAEHAAEWLWHSLHLSEPCDLKFEELIPRHSDDLITFIEPPVPNDVYRDFAPTYQAIRRLIKHGFHPDFVLDVGASVGVWSYVVSKLLPAARFILVDPLFSSYNDTTKQIFLASHSEFELVEVAISNQSGKTSLQVSTDLYGSSLLHPADFRAYKAVEVEIKTLDQLAQEKAIEGRGLLKIDVQCAEHLVLEGAKELIAQIDAVVLESSLVRYDESAKVFSEMIQIMDSLGFRYYDDVGYWRSPVDGTLLQKDAFFIRGDLYIPETGKI